MNTNVFAVTNPLLVVEILLKSFAEMDERTFQQELQRICKRGSAFLQLDDSSFAALLSEEEATSYADLCRTCLKYYKRLEEERVQNYPRPILERDMAEFIAFWHVLNTFRTLHGDGPLSEKE